MIRTSSWLRFVSLFSLCLIAIIPHGVMAASSNYKLGSGDLISINVYGEDDLTIQTRLGESGVINYPYLGLVRVKGLSVAELETRLVKGLKGDYLLQPSVHVSVLEYRPFYIYGEVNRPGGYPFQPGLTVERAVALAGGLTERASKRKMTINRTISGREKAIAVKMATSVQPDDSIFIKDSFF